VAEPDPSENPFANVPFLGDIAKAMASQGSMHWEIARQLAILGANEVGADQNVNPASRIAIETLLPIAVMHVREVSGVDFPDPVVESVTPAMWAYRTLETYKPLFEELATSLSNPNIPSDEASDPMAAMMAGLSRMLAPSMLGMVVGSMVGQLSQRAFGQFDLPLPRNERTMMVVPATIEIFADEWSVTHDDARMWTLLHELATHSFFSSEHTRSAVWNAVHNHVKGFRIDPSSTISKMTDLDLDPSSVDPASSLQMLFSDPELMLGTTTSPEQQANRPQLDALIALVIGFTDHVVDACASRLLGAASPIAEALRRRRLESSQVDTYVEHLLGLRLERAHIERGHNFVSGVIERTGTEALTEIFKSASALPTPAEIDAPGLWLARLEITI
jgi:putative hydrolase